MLKIKHCGTIAIFTTRRLFTFFLSCQNPHDAQISLLCLHRVKNDLFARLHFDVAKTMT